jgi:hypothetical protein
MIVLDLIPPTGSYLQLSFASFGCQVAANFRECSQRLFPGLCRVTAMLSGRCQAGRQV